MLPLSVVVLIGVFGLQPLGSGRIGRLFGPIMTLWFVTIGVLGLHGILRHPGVLAAIDPRYGLGYLFTHGMTGFLVLGGVFLCATGAEALYADMGHFGPRPIRVAWYGLVLPTLLLNYAGQAAIVVDGDGRRPTPIRSSRCVRRRCRCRSSRSPRRRRSSPARRSSAAPSR